MRRRLDEDRESIADSSFLGSGIAGSDHGYTLKRYLLDTETVLGDSPTFGPTTPGFAPHLPDLPADRNLQFLATSSSSKYGSVPLEDGDSAKSRLIPNDDGSQWMRVGHHGHHLRDSDNSKNDVPLMAAQNVQQTFALYDSEIVSTTAPATYQLADPTPSLNPSRSSPALDVFNSVGKGGTQRFYGFDFVFGQPHGAESSLLTEIDHELEKKKLESQSILSEPKVLPHNVRGHTEPRSKARTPFPDSVKQESKTQPDAGQTAKRTLPTRVSSKAGDANIQTHVKGEMLSAKTKGEQVQRSMRSGVEMNTPKPNVTFTEPEITHYTDLVYSGSEDMEPDEQPASNEQEAGDGKMRPGDNLEVLDSISGSENRSRPLSLGEKFPGRSVSSSPSIEDEDIDFIAPRGFFLRPKLQKPTKLNY
jgi:hypothetical protein